MIILFRSSEVMISLLVVVLLKNVVPQDEKVAFRFFRSGYFTQKEEEKIIR
jgi:hypothetical protein